MRNSEISIALMVLALAIASDVGAREKQVVAGAGPSTKIVEKFFTEFAKLPTAKDYEFSVPPKSAKHAGGIKASAHYVFGRTGRPLNPKEKKLNKEEIFLARIPVVFAVGNGVKTESLTLEQLEKIITGKYNNWKEVGGDDANIVVLGREKTEAVFTVLKSQYGFFESSVFSKVYRKDDLVVNFLKSPNGVHAIGFGAEPNFRDVGNVRIIKVRDFSAGVSVGLVYDMSNKNLPLVNAVADYADSEQWAEIISAEGYLPPGP